jgi:hypothetical protein
MSDRDMKNYNGTEWEFRFSLVVSVKMTALWINAPCSDLEVNWCLRGTMGKSGTQI